MKTHVKHLITLGCFAAIYAPLNGRSATIWNGPLITYTQPSPNPNVPANQDMLTAHVSLTRGVASGGSGTGGMFNGITETSFTRGVSPADTEWALGELTNYANLPYNDWTTTAGNPVHVYPNQQAVVHLISDDIYLSLKYTDLPSGSGFTYIRSTPAPAAPPTISITAVTANTLTLSWPVAGGRLQSQTNGLGTNWATVPNSTTTNSMVIPINRANSSVFYRLAVP